MKNQESISIAIIGGGASGTAVTHYLIQEFRKSSPAIIINIEVYEKRGIFGSGLAFERDNDALLMNMVSRDASLFAEDSENFWRWLAKTMHQEYRQYVISGSAMAPNGFVPRGLFGKYMSYIFDQVECEAKNLGINFSRRYTEVRCVGKCKEGYELVAASGDVYKYDLVVVCTGNTEPQDIFGLLGHARYINNPYPVRSYLSKIPPNDRIGVVGSQLTAADIAIVLAQNGHKGSIKLLARTSELPSIRSVLRPHALRYMNIEGLHALRRSSGGSIRLRDIFRLLRKEFLSVGGDWREILFRSSRGMSSQEYFAVGINNALRDQAWQSVMVAIDHVIEHYWRYLSEQDKSLFMERFHRHWSSKRAPLPVTTAYKLNALMLDDQLEFCFGLRDVFIAEDEKFLAEVSCRPDKNNGAIKAQMEFDWIINATGPSRHINEMQGSILGGLIKAGIAQKSPHGGIKVDFHTSAVIDSLGNPDTALYAVGQPANGTYYFVSSLEMISLRAKSAAKAMAGIVSNAAPTLVKSPEASRHDEGLYVGE